MVDSLNEEQTSLYFNFYGEWTTTLDGLDEILCVICGRGCSFHAICRNFQFNATVPEHRFAKILNITDEIVLAIDIRALKTQDLVCKFP